MKTIIAILLLAFSMPALAVDVTITLTTPQAVRVAAACGKILALRDAQDQPRACTMPEAKQWLIQFIRHAVTDAEQQDAQKAIVIQTFEPT